MTDDPRPGDDVADEPRPSGEGDAVTTDDARGDKPGSDASSKEPSSGRRFARLARELVIIVAVALVASALLRAFVVQAYYVPSGSMLPAIHLQDRILVSRIGDIDRGEVVVFEDPDQWIPSAEQPDPPGDVRKALEWLGVLPASGHEHLVKRVVGLPGDHVVCCNNAGRLVINGQPVDESDFLFQGDRRADESDYDVVVPEDSIFVLGDHRYVSGDSSRHLEDVPFVPMDNVVGRAFAVIWPAGHMGLLEIPDAYDDVPDGQVPPEHGIIKKSSLGSSGDR